MEYDFQIISNNDEHSPLYISFSVRCYHADMLSFNPMSKWQNQEKKKLTIYNCNLFRFVNTYFHGL